MSQSFLDDCGFIARDEENYVDVDLSNNDINFILQEYFNDDASHEQRAQFKELAKHFYTSPLICKSIRIRVYKNRFALANSKEEQE